MTERGNTEHEEIAWDARRWREKGDNGWTAGCRWLQAWWRDQVLHMNPGEPTGSMRDGLVSSMLPLGSDSGLNFLDPSIRAAVEARLAEGDHSGIIEKDRLYRNLLSSQPTCFNL